MNARAPPFGAWMTDGVEEKPAAAPHAYQDADSVGVLDLHETHGLLSEKRQRLMRISENFHFGSIDIYVKLAHFYYFAILRSTGIDFGVADNKSFKVSV